MRTFLCLLTTLAIFLAQAEMVDTTGKSSSTPAYGSDETVRYRYVEQTVTVRRKVPYMLRARGIEKVANEDLFLLFPSSAQHKPYLSTQLQQFFKGYAYSCPGDKTPSEVEATKLDNRVRAYILDITDEVVAEKRIVASILENYRPYIFVAQFDDQGKAFSKSNWLKILKQIPTSQACFLIAPGMKRVSNGNYYKELRRLIAERNHSCQLMEVTNQQILSSQAGQSCLRTPERVRTKSHCHENIWMTEFKYEICDMDPRTFTRFQAKPERKAASQSSTQADY